jgi:sulfur-oxidizing protein SoxY
MTGLSRRDILALGAGSAAFAMFIEVLPATATTAEAAAEIAKFTGGKTAAKGKIAIELPEIAENGNTVPLSFTVESKMADDDYVSDVLVVLDGNPRPGLATFHFTPLAGRAEAATRIRLATTQNVIVVAKTSKGEFLTDRKQVKVTIGGCGG